MRTLCSELGGSTEYWLWEVSEAHACWLLRAIDQQRRREAGAMARAAGQFDPDSPKVYAVAEYCQAVDKVKKRIGPIGPIGPIRPIGPIKR